MILSSLFLFLWNLFQFAGIENVRTEHFMDFPKMNSHALNKSQSMAADSIIRGTYYPNSSKASELVNFAESLKGITYKYGASDPKRGFDCSGFIYYVFQKFNIKVPRASREFTNFAKEIKLKDAQMGDLILFTGTDSTKRAVGHMGIITSNNGKSHEFIHSTSGKAYGVTITPLNKYYQGRFVKVIRILKEDKI